MVKLVGNFGKSDCDGCMSMDNPIFKDNGQCDCGVNKHHYHCSVCGYITQIG